MTQIATPVISATIESSNPSNWENRITVTFPDFGDYVGTTFVNLYRSHNGGAYQFISRTGGNIVIDSTIPNNPSGIYYYKVFLDNVNYDDSEFSNVDSVTISINDYTISPQSRNFGTIILNDSEKTQNISIVNNGTNTLTFTTTPSTNFYFLPASKILNAGQSGSITLYARTNNLGSHNETPTINVSNGDTVPIQAISNIVDPPDYGYTVTPTSLDYGTIFENSTEPSKTVIINNIGLNTLNFTFTNTTNFYTNTANLQILAGQSAAISIKARTTNVGSHNENFVINESNAGNTNVNCISTISAIPILELSPNSHDFGSFNKVLSGFQGGINVTILDFVGGRIYEFPNTENFVPCALNTQTEITQIDPQFDPQFTLRYRNVNTGINVEDFIIRGTNTGNPDTASMSVTGETTNDFSINVLPSPYDFGQITENFPYPTQTFTVTNTSSSPSNQEFSVSGSTNFLVSPSTITVPATGSIQFTVSARTDTIGTYNEIITLTPTNPFSFYDTVEVDLSSEIIAPTYSYDLNPTSFNFGEIFSGATNQGTDLEITNTGTGDLNITFTGTTNFSVSVSSINILFGQTQVVTIFAETDNLGVHNENILLGETNAGGTSFNVQSEVIEYDPCFITVTSGLTAWYEDSVNSGQNLYFLGENTPINQWDDKSGNNNHAQVTPSGSQGFPLKKGFPSEPNFGGIQTTNTGAVIDNFNTVSIPQNNGDKTIFYVGSVNLQPQFTDLFVTTSPTRDGVISSTYGNINELVYVDDNSVEGNWNSNAGQTERVLVTLALSGGSNVLGRLNGNEKFNNVTTSTADGIITEIGGNDSLGGSFQFVMNAFLVYDRRLTDEEIQEVEQCLGQNYGVDVERDFQFTSQTVDFGNVEYSTSGDTLQNTVISNVTGITSIDWTDLANFSVSASTKPIVLTSSGDSEIFNVIYDAPIVALGNYSEDFTMTATGHTESFEILINVILFAPSDLDGISYFNTAFLNWVDNTVSAPIDGFRIYRDGVLIGTSTTTSYEDLNLTEGQTYTYEVRSYIDGIGESSGTTFQLTASSAQLPAFCELGDAGYTVTDTTACGADDGIIQINNFNLYGSFYEFTLTDIDGSPLGSPNSLGQWTSLEPKYYKITAIPITNKLRDTCSIEWIELNDSALNFGITGETISPAICGLFNTQAGRNVIGFSGLTTGGTYTLYKSTGEVEYTGTTENPLVLTGLIKGLYYLKIDDGCILLHSFTIGEETSGLSVPNVKEIYITEFTDDLDYNYRNVNGNPTLQSLFISEYLNTDTWYSIEVDEQNTNYTQTLSKSRQGLTLTDVLTIGVPFNETDKWNALKTLLPKRWVVVFQDGNDNWFTFGYFNGADVVDYTFGSELGGFTLGFSALLPSKIITSIDEDYVNNNIR